MLFKTKPTIIFFSLIIHLVTITTHIVANDKIDTLNKAKKNSSSLNKPFKFGFFLYNSYNKPIQYSGKYWRHYFTTGITLYLPTYFSNLRVHFSAGIGKISKIYRSIIDIKILQASASIGYEFSLYKNYFFIKPRFGISSMTIHFLDIDKLTHINANSENEFGFIGGIEPFLRIKRFYISLPILINFIFSAPKLFNTTTFSLTYGIVF